MTEHAQSGQTRRTPADGEFDDEQFDPEEYDAMLLLERLESLEEEMRELGVNNLDDIHGRMAELNRALDESDR